jgi:hypothetical protein
MNNEEAKDRIEPDNLARQNPEHPLPIHMYIYKQGEILSFERSEMQCDKEIIP